MCGNDLTVYDMNNFIEYIYLISIILIVFTYITIMVTIILYIKLLTQFQ